MPRSAPARQRIPSNRDVRSGDGKRQRSCDEVRLVGGERTAARDSLHAPNMSPPVGRWALLFTAEDAETSAVKKTSRTYERDDDLARSHVDPGSRALELQAVRVDADTVLVGRDDGARRAGDDHAPYAVEQRMRSQSLGECHDVDGTLVDRGHPAPVVLEAQESGVEQPTVHALDVERVEAACSEWLTPESDHGDTPSLGRVECLTSPDATGGDRRRVAAGHLNDLRHSITRERAPVGRRLGRPDESAGENSVEPLPVVRFERVL